MIDRVQVLPRIRGDVHEPHGSPWVHGASHHVADDTHGLEIQLAQSSIPCRHLGEVVAQPRRATARFPVVRPRGHLDSQFRSASRGHQFSVERRDLTAGSIQGARRQGALKLCRYSGDLSNATVMEPPTTPGARRRPGRVGGGPLPQQRDTAQIAVAARGGAAGAYGWIRDIPGH